MPQALSPAARRRRKGPAGALLVEMIMALLLVAAAVSAVVGVMMSAPLQSRRSLAQEQAALYTGILLAELRSYVTADLSPVPGAPGSPAWHLPGDDCQGGMQDCWALAEGVVHNASSLLPARFREPPFNATLTYTVTVEQVNGLPTRRVEARLDWTPPSI